MVNSYFWWEGHRPGTPVIYLWAAPGWLSWVELAVWGRGVVLCLCAGWWGMPLRCPLRMKGFVPLLLEVLPGDSPQLSVLFRKCFAQREPPDPRSHAITGATCIQWLPGARVKGSAPFLQPWTALRSNPALELPKRYGESFLQSAQWLSFSLCPIPLPFLPFHCDAKSIS